MAIETVLVKRGALYKGEIGFFPDNEMAADDIAPATMGEEVICRFYRPRQIEALKFLWAMVHKAADNSDLFLNKDDAMEKLKVRVGYTRVLYDRKTKELKPVPKSLVRIDSEALRILTDRIADVICTEVMPGMRRNDLYREIEEMVGVR
jgi:hypothetical protein